MKIAYFCDTFAPQINGVSTTLTKLNHYAKTHGIETVFLVPDYPDARRTEENVYRFFSLPLFCNKECRVAIPPLFRAERILDEFQPDLIHAYSEFTLSLAAIRYAAKKNIPIVSSYTSNFSTYLHYYNLSVLNPCLETYLNWFHNRCRLTFCPTEHTKDYLSTKSILRTAIMQRGVDPSRFGPSFRSAAFRRRAGAKKDSLIFTYVGRVAPEKDLDILCEAAKSIKKRYGDRAIFVLVGDGPSLREIKKALGVSAFFTGYLTGGELSSAYASSDVLVFPSTTETFGNVVLEAMCSGLPAIVPRAGGVAELVTHGRDGFVVPPRDPQALALSIQRFLQNPGIVRNMSANALETARSRSWETVFTHLFSRYRELLSGEGA